MFRLTKFNLRFYKYGTLFGSLERITEVAQVGQYLIIGHYINSV